ncbi:unnamed protein product [Dicrocoelium dendriticum]|nr:unnamed protein product [Dicrocoelium dendriticum]
MPFIQEPISPFETIRSMNANLDQWHGEKNVTFQEKFKTYKHQMETSNVILSYSHWVMSERLRVEDPQLYNTWYHEMQSTGIETPVPKSTRSAVEQHVQRITHVLKRAAEHNVDFDASPPRPSTSMQPLSAITSSKLHDMFDTVPPQLTRIPDELLHEASQTAESDNTFVQDIVQRINSTDNLWTFIYRGPEPVILSNHRSKAILIKHDDHYHVVFQSLPQHLNRSLQHILQALSIPPSNMFDILTTIQPIIDWYRFATYLARSGCSVQLIGNKLQPLASHTELTPVDQKDCAQFNRDPRHIEQQKAKRTKCTDLLNKLIDTHRCTHIKDLKRRITRKQRLTLYVEFGIQWERTAKQCIEAYNVELFNRQTNISFEEYIMENNHYNVCTHPEDRSTTFFDDLLRVNNIDKDAFCTAIHEIMNKKIDQLNTFCIEGPTTTGKSLLLKLISQNYHCGTVQMSADHSRFFLQNLVDKAVALMKEPRITIKTVNDFKALLGGNTFDIHVKHSPDVTLLRVPVLISTNRSLGNYITSVDAAAIYECCHKFKFNVRVGCAELPEPPTTFCACHFSFWYGNWWQTNRGRFDI